MGYVISIANEKGGVGKTTTTYNLGVSLAKQGQKVLMIDFDYQCSLTYICGYHPGQPDFFGASTVNFFSGSEPQEALFTIDAVEDYFKTHLKEQDITDSLSLTPGSKRMALIEREVGRNPQLKQRFVENVRTLAPYFNYILIDCLPTLNDMLLTALAASDGVIIPVKPEFLDNIGTEQLMETIKEAQNSNLGLHVLGTVLNMYRGTVSEHKEYLVKLQSDTETPLLGTVKLSSLVTKGYRIGLPAALNAQQSQPATEFMSIAKQIIAITKE